MKSLFRRPSSRYIKAGISYSACRVSATTPNIDSNLNVEEINMDILKDILTRYMNTVISVCKINKDSTQCFFDIYKTSKTVFELLNFEEIHRHLTFSPGDKKTNQVPSKVTNENKKILNTHNKNLKRYSN